MKILQLNNKVPFPEKDGGALGVSVFAKAFVDAGQQLKMLAMNTSRHFTDSASIPQKFKNDTKLETVYVDTAVKPLKALMALLKGESYNVSRFISAEFESKLSSLLKNETYDVIQLEGLYLTPYIKVLRNLTKAPIILREHNIEWLIWERLANEDKNPLKAIYFKILTRQLKNYESSVINSVDGITTTTANDMQRLKEMGCKVPIAHIPFGIDTSKYKVTSPEKRPSLFYLGALDWLPNIQGVDWFLQQVWPKVNAAYPALEFHVAGRNMPAKYKTASYPNLTFHGEIDDAFAFMNKYDIMLVPLLAGSGIRVKIIEGMALGKPIITTSIGIEGIECRNGSDALIANTPDDFFKAIKQCLESDEFSQTLSQNARNFAIAAHDIKKITAKLLQFYKDRINGTSLN
jgi:glycosyltransferase involved in cell wall biosynthesis